MSAAHYCQGFCSPSATRLNTPHEVRTGVCAECWDRVDAESVDGFGVRLGGAPPEFYGEQEAPL